MSDRCELKNVGNYIIKQILGRGAYAEVRLGQNKLTSQQVALKIMHRRNIKDMKKVRKEIEVLRHSALRKETHIIQILEVIESAEFIALALEYAPNGSLLDYLNAKKERCLSERDAKKFFLPIVQAVRTCHRNNIIHRDLKCENILLGENMNIKLADFGFATQIHDTEEKLNEFCGSVHYSAPEIIFKEPYKGPPVDVFSLGVILYTMLCGGHPFVDRKTNSIDYISLETCRFNVPPTLSSEVKELLELILVRNPEQRPSVDEILTHRWFTQNTNTNTHNIHTVNYNIIKSNPTILQHYTTTIINQKQTTTMLPCHLSMEQEQELLFSFDEDEWNSTFIDCKQHINNNNNCIHSCIKPVAIVSLQDLDYL